MRIAAIVAASLLVSGCVGYQPRNGQPFDGAAGYSEKRLSAGHFLVRYDGRFEQSYGQLRSFLVRRASELCPGSFTISEYSRENGWVMEADNPFWKYVQAKVSCGDPPIDHEIHFGKPHG